MKNQLAIVATASMLWLLSCSNEPTCNFEGSWSVEPRIESSILSKTIVSIAEEDYRSSVYRFEKEGKMYIDRRAEGSTSQQEATWQFDPATQQLSWKGVSGQPAELNETFEVKSCSADTIVLFQRLPPEPDKEEVAKVTLTLARMK
ncbi:MAG: hypothetical protein KatS3mg029_1011 [Saprospiraceae bacterium]|nr:MAG: hypothetical protein KatS3mg029_1011 [Saprospiraceae bacterium]